MMHVIDYGQYDTPAPRYQFPCAGGCGRLLPAANTVCDKCDRPSVAQFVTGLSVVRARRDRIKDVIR